MDQAVPEDVGEADDAFVNPCDDPTEAVPLGLVDVEPIDIDDLAASLATRGMTEAEAETYVDMSCEAWAGVTSSPHSDLD